MKRTITKKPFSSPGASLTLPLFWEVMLAVITAVAKLGAVWDVLMILFRLWVKEVLDLFERDFGCSCLVSTPELALLPVYKIEACCPVKDDCNDKSKSSQLQTKHL